MYTTIVKVILNGLLRNHVALGCHLLAARGKFLAFKHYLRPEGLPPLQTYLLKGLAPMVSVCEYKDSF